MSFNVRSLFLKTATILFLLVNVGCSGLSDRSKSMINTNAPATRVNMLDSGYVSLEEFRGHDLFIMFWATWCAKSRPAIEEFNDLGRKYAASTGATFIAVSVDKAEAQSVLKARIEQNELHSVRHAFSGNDEYDETFMGLKGDYIPYVVIIDSQGVVRAVSDSPSAIEDYLEQKNAH